ncbi:hypothetical protein BNJ_00325 [Kaumoebavirus]|nr:hypothetical protein BNJ_00325 [Kaumoebavirus]ARA72147.1 hypothetical protein BNJ_00325 [Kaumoebavirus]
MDHATIEMRRPSHDVANVFSFFVKKYSAYGDAHIEYMN